VYVDANPNCNTLNFQLGNTGQGAAIANRAWSIKVKPVFSVLTMYGKK